MRTAFAILVLGVLAATGWALWDDARPEWRRYQRELIRRETARLETELAEARAEAARPELREELARLDERLRTASADSSGAAGPAAGPALDLERALARAEERGDSLRTALREAESRRRDAALVAEREALETKLAEVQRRYAALTGSWPPDTLRISGLWAERDSLSDALLALEGPAPRMKDELDAARGEAEQLRAVLRDLRGPRDSLEAERARLVEPVTRREAALAALRSRTPRVVEISSPDGRVTARCPTCHGTLEDPPGVHPALPAAETFRDAPCTVCHGGNGRALDVAGAHQGLIAGDDAGPYSIRGRIDLLRRLEPGARHQALEDLRMLTDIDPADWADASVPLDSDSAVVTLWTQWWSREAATFEPGEEAQEEGGDSPLLALGIDPWNFSARGRAYRYVGSRECLRCHEVRHREHSRRWMATKFRSIERLVEEADPTPCLECHATGFDPASGAYAEPGVTCEACHGPGERYNEMMVVGQELLDQGAELRGNALLDFSSRLAREAVSRRSVPRDSGPANVCVQCHHPRRHAEGGPGVLERAEANGDAEGEQS